MPGETENVGREAAHFAEQTSQNSRNQRTKKSKRGQSGLSLLVAVNKPIGMTSHDVVNAVRRIFGERRVGHTGTLDPLATGVLPICIGPATRLDNYLTGSNKRYRVRIAFGYETTTDDSEGERTLSAPVSELLRNESYADSFVSSLIGKHEQIPPLYSAIKVNGVKSYEAARNGKEIDLSPRIIEIFESQLLEIGELEEGFPYWEVDFLVSKGTYVRSLARDIGRMMGTAAHVDSLHRSSTGFITEEQAVSLHTLEQLKELAAIDPLVALGLRYAFADEVERFVASGNALKKSQLVLNEALVSETLDICKCTSSVVRSALDPSDGETVCVVVKNRLKALYTYSQDKDIWKANCVFSTGIRRN